MARFCLNKDLIVCVAHSLTGIHTYKAEYYIGTFYSKRRKFLPIRLTLYHSFCKMDQLKVLRSTGKTLSVSQS